MHLPHIGRGQHRLAKPNTEGLSEKLAARTQMLDPKSAASYLTALGNHGQLGSILETAHHITVTFLLLVKPLTKARAQASSCSMPSGLAVTSSSALQNSKQP